MAVQGLRRDDINKVEGIDTIGRRPRTFVVNEPGLYRLIFRSNKPEADHLLRCGTIAAGQNESQPKNPGDWAACIKLLRRTKAEIAIFNGKRPTPPDFL